MKLKNILSKSLITGVVLATTMAVSAVSAFAATNTYYYFTGTDDDAQKDDYFTVTGGGSSNLYVKTDGKATAFTFSGEETPHVPTKTIKMNSSGKVEFTVEGTASLEFIWSPKSANNSSMKLTSNDQTIDLAGNSSNSISEYTVATASNLAAGKYTIARNSQENYIYGIKVIDVVSDNAKSYIVTGSISGLPANTEFTIGDFDAKVSEDGNTYTISKTSESDPFSGLGILSASYTDEYTVSYGESATGVNFTQLSETAYTGTTIEFTRKELSTVAEGTYNSNWSRPNFDVTTASGNAIIGGNTSTKFEAGTKLSFKTTGSAIINFTTKDGGNNDSTDSTVSYTLFDENNNKIAKSTVFSAANEQTQNFFVPTAGTYTFQVDADSKTSCYFRKMVITYKNSTDVTSGIIVSDGTDMYVIAKIPSTENLADYANIDLGGSTSETVYEAVEINGTTYGNDGNYYYAVKVTPASVSSAGNNITNFKYTLTPIE